MKKFRFIKGIEALMLAAILAAPVNVLASEPEEKPVEETQVEEKTDETSAETPTEAPTEPKIETMILETTPEPSAQQTSGENLPETPENNDPVVSVIFPSLPEDGESPLDFLIDPEQLVYLTDAEAYGGGRVDSGATILFRNYEGDYDFSRYSDRFEVINQSDVPVVVTVTAQMTNLGEIDMMDNPYFGDSEACTMYMAVVDNEGHERPLIDNGSVTIQTEMAAVDQYSFGLIGYCNPLGRWQDIYVAPRVTLTWNMEPVLPEGKAPEVEIYNEILETEPYEEPGEPDPDPTPTPDATILEIDKVQEEHTSEPQANTTPESPADGQETTVDEEPPPPDDSDEPGPPSDD
ncbi:hypothetical protein [Pseudobutyrivibrio xylanivorans]|uniref:DUF4352 domain-containing protein n=1 Tax=Pseudobutyrivibrio xylanivorans TaxID=185007 RepID=A0A1G5RPS3_PSEXY|nr:hypothetical protein [Pseudobutyrivibrio xylanivorans]SCZ76122.1 hypothetical protein SAMN02910350_00091 [Pseudobutyrivibrio xylanivorans]